MLGALARLAAVGTAGAVYVLGVRPQLQHWGATEAEAGEDLPGDGLVPAPRFASTRAITVAAPASAIWPWLAQVGEGRAGLYTYEWLERLLGPAMASADTIEPELQDLGVGDTVRLAPIGGPDGLIVTAERLEVPALLVFRSGRTSGAQADGDDGHAPDVPSASDYFAGGPAASWALVLRPIEGGATRLLSRWRMSWAPSAAADLFNGAIVEPVHFALEEKMLRGIRDRAERGSARPVQPPEPDPVPRDTA
jgi:hypothetical protein